jgi:hypothetical protein
LGMDFEELTEQWHKYIKKEYYPDVAGRDEVKDIAKPLTNHKKKKLLQCFSHRFSRWK